MIDAECPYRSKCGTCTGISGVFSLVWVPSMDLYEHSAFLDPQRTGRRKVEAGRPVAFTRLARV